jgi:uncharacterized membrane protein HdeD (DUF308 family)
MSTSTTLLRKWWVILLQGILLIILSFMFFNNPVQVLAVLSLWIGVITLIIGAMGLIGYFMMEKQERESSILWWSIASLILGFLMISRLGLTMKSITVIFGIWILLTGFSLTSSGWAHRANGSLGWIIFILGILTIIAGIAIIFNIRTGAIWISTILGFQALFAGIGFIVLALIKRKVINRVKDIVSSKIN